MQHTFCWTELFFLRSSTITNIQYKNKIICNMPISTFFCRNYKLNKQIKEQTKFRAFLLEHSFTIKRKRKLLLQKKKKTFAKKKKKTDWISKKTWLTWICVCIFTQTNRLLCLYYFPVVYTKCFFFVNHLFLFRQSINLKFC